MNWKLLTEHVIIWAWHGLILLVWPPAVFWSLGTLVPSWSIPCTWQTGIAFWILYHGVRVGLYKLRHPEWESPISRVLPDYEF